MKKEIWFYCGPEYKSVAWVTYIPEFCREDEAYLRGKEYGDKIIREEIIFEDIPWKMTWQEMHDGPLPDPDILQGLDGKWYVVHYYHEGPASWIEPLENNKELI